MRQVAVVAPRRGLDEQVLSRVGDRRQPTGIQDRFVRSDLNALLTALHVKIDDHLGGPPVLMMALADCGRWR